MRQNRDTAAMLAPTAQQGDGGAHGFILEPVSGRAAAPATAFTGALVLAAAALAFFVLGYHPYAEDGGIYSAAVAARLDPTFFPADRAFVVAHTRFAWFVPLVATSVRGTHLSPATILLGMHLLGIVGLLAAGVHLAQTCLPRAPRWAAAVSLAVGMGLPVAGTSLYAVDPYCTGRSLSSPLLLFAFSFALRGRWAFVTLLWCAAAVLHPLMALWSALPFVLCFAWPRQRRVMWLAGIAVVGAAACVLLQLGSAPESAAARAAAITRAYWFVSQWRWYELLGALAPPCLLGWAASALPREAVLRRCAHVCAAATALALLVALCFARLDAPSFAVARLQPLRTVHLVFLVFLALAGPFLMLRARFRWQRAALLLCAVAMGTSVVAMERSLFPDTRHVEWPGEPSGNAWQEAFAWCRKTLPAEAVVALPADYIDLPGEDSHAFRAIALRSALPDLVKDAGVVAVLPSLSPVWRTGVEATRNLVSEEDSARRAHLLPLGVSWLVLPAAAQTTLECPFHNAAAKVCRLARN